MAAVGTVREIACLALLAVTLGGCAVPAKYMGVSTRTPMSPAEQLRIQSALADGTMTLAGCPWYAPDGYRVTIACELLPPSQLAGLAWAGDRHAALELGIRFEEGRGVPIDIEKARKLYRLASVTTGGTMWIYTPRMGEAPAQIMPYDAPVVQGLPAARERLEALPPPLETPRRRKSRKP